MRVAIEGLPSVNEDASDIDAADPGVLDTDSLAFLRRDMEERSVATTRLASEVGSVMGAPKIPRVKSFTFYAGKDTDDDDDESDNNVPVDWNMELKDGQIRRKARVLVDSVRGSMAEWCGIRAGDHLKSINGTDISAKWDAARAKQHMQTCLTEDGYLSVAAVDPDGDEVWIRATIIKPNPEATLADLGMTVWYWGYVSHTLPRMFLMMSSNYHVDSQSVSFSPCLAV